MRIATRLCFATLALAAAGMSAPAEAQVLATSVTASFPDPAGKVPHFNAVPGAAIPTWSIGLAQGVLVNGQSYNYCVSLASATADGSASVSFKIARGKTVIQSGLIIRSKDFAVGSNGVWYFCSGYLVLPNSPGPATLSGAVAYVATGSTTQVKSIISVPVLLQ